MKEEQGKMHESRNQNVRKTTDTSVSWGWELVANM